MKIVPRVDVSGLQAELERALQVVREYDKGEVTEDDLADWERELIGADDEYARETIANYTRLFEERDAARKECDELKKAATLTRWQEQLRTEQFLLSKKRDDARIEELESELADSRSKNRELVRRTCNALFSLGVAQIHLRDGRIDAAQSRVTEAIAELEK